MDIHLLSQRIEQKITAFSRTMGLPDDDRPETAPGQDAAAEINQLREELEHMTSLYEESLCVWEHEMELLKTRLAETGHHKREVENLRSIQATADEEAGRKNLEIARLFARVDELKKENAVLENDTRRLISQLRTAWQSAPLDGVRRRRHGVARRILQWLFHPMITTRGSSHE